MVHGDPRTHPHKYTTAQTSDGRHRRLHIMWEAGHHHPQTHGMRDGGRNIGKDPYKTGGDTQNGQETNTPWMAPWAYLQTVAATTTSGDIVDPRKFGILPSS